MAELEGDIAALFRKEFVALYTCFRNKGRSNISGPSQEARSR